MTAAVVAAAVTDVGKVRSHNEDAYVVEADDGLFLVCDGMGGHAAGEVASGLATRIVRERWRADEVRRAVDAWARTGDPDARRALLTAVRDGVLAAHAQIVAESASDLGKRGMGTTFTGFLIAGGDAIFAHAGDSRAYLVRDGIAQQLSEDHTLLARLAAAGVDVGGSAGESRWKGVLTNALGLGDDTRVTTFVVPLAVGDRVLLCSDGVSEYVAEAEVGQVLTGQPSPARAAQRLVELALDRGGADNATAVVVKVLEVGETPVAAGQRARDAATVASSPLLAGLNPQQRLRALRIAIPRDLPAKEPIPAHAQGDRVAWLILDGEARRRGQIVGAGALLYPESLVRDRPALEGDELATAVGAVRALCLRCDDFGELTGEDPDLGVPMYQALGTLLGAR